MEVFLHQMRKLVSLPLAVMTELPGRAVKRVYFTQPDCLMKLIVLLTPTVNEHEERIYNLQHSLCLLIYY